MSPNPLLDPDGTAALSPALSASPSDTIDATADRTRDRTPDADHTPPPGAPNIPGYLITGEIARGGMGCVYAGRELALDREVAIKTLLPQANAERFITESKITAKLPHPNIPPVYALGTIADGSPYLAMKLIRGRTLADELKARPDLKAELPRFLQVFEQIAQAVGFAHAQGIIHRDLKPANVMVGEFGEVQVMDWGLAKHLTNRQPEQQPQLADNQDEQLTQAGTVMGTPAYMAPEQARGEVVDARADVFALGGILTAILTGKAVFSGTTARETITRAASGDTAESLARLDECGMDAELVKLAKLCVAISPDHRPADGQAVAKLVAAYRHGVDERLKQAETERASSLVREAEQRKRRRVQLALAGFAVLVAVAGGIAAVVVQQDRAAKQQEADRLANDKQRAEDNLVAETKRQSDLRETRAGALVDALATAETVSVPRVARDLAEFRDLTGARLRELAGQPVGTKPGLHARLALLADEPGRAAELAAYLPVCRSEELLTIRDALMPHAGAVGPGLWAVLTDVKAGVEKRVRAACALAGLVPADEQWKVVAPAVSDLVVLENPLAAAVWFAALEPVREVLVPALVKRYPEARGRLRGGKLDEVQLAAEVSGYDLTATALARYTGDRPAEAADLMLQVDPRHAAQFVPAVSANKEAVVPVLKAELAKKPKDDWTDEQHEALARRRAQAAAVLLTLGEAESVWPVFAFPKDGDPTARSYLLARLVDLGADPSALMRRFEVEPDVSAKRALLVALGGFPVEVVPGAEREALTAKLLVVYREHPDPGLHGAIDWLLRQKWGKANDVAAIDAELAAAMRAQVLARGLADLAPGSIPVGLLLPAPAVAEKRDWFVNGEGQTYAVVRGPVEFTLGSPKTEPGRNEVHEPPHRKRIGRTFAIGTKEVTVEQFLRFRPKHDWLKQYSPGPDTPAVSVTWYDGAAYCNWLSEREGIPEDQWCYEPAKGGVYGEGMRMKAGHLKRTGYRLPTEAEWEFACRGGAVTTRSYGRGEDLLPRYSWSAKNAEDRAWPVGQLRPNELGLFDTLGNALEWVEDPALLYVTGQTEDIENSKQLLIDDRVTRLLRGGSFGSQPTGLRPANRDFPVRPGYRVGGCGFRPVRTLP